jgi:hypothetical protein
MNIDNFTINSEQAVILSENASDIKIYAQIRSAALDGERSIIVSDDDIDKDINGYLSLSVVHKFRSLGFTVACQNYRNEMLDENDPNFYKFVCSYLIMW